MAFESVDPETRRLMMEMLLDDLARLESRQKGKQVEGQTTDVQDAIAAYKNELQSCLIATHDEIQCRSMVRAMRKDADMINVMTVHDNQTLQDREFACNVHRRLNNKEPPRSETQTIPVNTTPKAEEADLELLRKYSAIFQGIETDDDEEDGDACQSTAMEGETSSWAGRRVSKSKMQDERTCIACRDLHYFFDVARCPCSHEYCRDCLQQLFSASMIDESLFPPRCCTKPIPLETNRIFLTPNLVGQFRAKKVEFETVDRTYCHKAECSTFVPPQFIKNDLGTCPRCEANTCTVCKAAAHNGDCPKDEAIQELERVARENEWQRCYACRRMVELQHGCNHMTCLCGAQFCYECGLEWKTCTCDTWEEERLYARSTVLVDREPGAEQLNAAERAQRVRQARNRLIQNHECQHDRWQSRGGRFRCEECRRFMPEFIYECRQCEIRVCRQCRFNRI